MIKGVPPLAHCRKIVQFGAGNIGRSLVGQLFSAAGWQVVFVDAKPEIIDALNERHSYIVRVKDDISEDIKVENVRGIHASERDLIATEIADADCIGTAVGPSALPRIFETLAAGLALRKAPISIIMCENLRSAAKIVRQGCLRHLPRGFDIDAVAGFVETSIGKMVPIMPEEVRSRDPLEVWAERYNKIIADADAFVGPLIDVAGIERRSNFTAYVDRKLFIHNMGHATCAYLGHLAGKTYIWEAMGLPEIERATRAAMWESARMLLARYKGVFTEAEQNDHVEDLLRRFTNRALGDTVFRVGRDLPRKLGPRDRFVAAMRLDFEYKIAPVETATGFAAGLLFEGGDESGEMFPPDAAFREHVRKSGVASALATFSRITREADAALYDLIIARYERLRR